MLTAHYLVITCVWMWLEGMAYQILMIWVFTYASLRIELFLWVCLRLGALKMYENNMISDQGLDYLSLLKHVRTFLMAASWMHDAIIHFQLFRSCPCFVCAWIIVLWCVSLECLEWCLDDNWNVNVKDTGSNWTPLHRCGKLNHKCMDI